MVLMADLAKAVTDFYKRTMRTRFMKLYRIIAVAVTIAYCCVWSTPAQAISIQEEEKLGSEFLKYVRQHSQLVEDPMIIGYVNQVGQKLLAGMPPQPFTYHFYVVKESVYNAFAVPAGHVFINSGLLAAMESEDELAGILGHEIGHVACRHISKRIERSQKVNIATMAGMVAGIFLGAATGDASAVQALTIGSAAAGQTAMLSFSRQDETQADEMGIQYSVKAGYSPQGLLSALNKIRSKQWFGSDQIPTYMMTHPALEGRMGWIDNWIATHSVKPIDSGMLSAPSPFKKVKSRLIALYENLDTALNHFQTALAKTPNDTNLIYGYGLALDRAGNRDAAITYLKKALAQNALDPFMLNDLGRIYFTQGHYSEAQNTLQGALSLTSDNPQGLFYLGRTYLSSGQLGLAADNFEQLLEAHPDYQEAYYYLGETYTKLNRMPEAHYNLGLFHYHKNDYLTARFHLTKAQHKINNPAKQEAIEKYLEKINRQLKEMEKAAR
jgi:beta-barrel assembly-enhancing protease